MSRAVMIWGRIWLVERYLPPTYNTHHNIIVKTKKITTNLRRLRFYWDLKWNIMSASEPNSVENWKRYISWSCKMYYRRQRPVNTCKSINRITDHINWMKYFLKTLKHSNRYRKGHLRKYFCLFWGHIRLCSGFIPLR